MYHGASLAGKYRKTRTSQAGGAWPKPRNYKKTEIEPEMLVNTCGTSRLS
jgi:hypothetical protein